MKKLMIIGLLALVLGASGCSSNNPNENGENNNEDDLPYCEDDDLDLDIPTFDDSTKYTYDLASNLENKSGEVQVLPGTTENTYTVSTFKPSSLAVDTTTPFTYGTIETTVAQTKANDSGIIFKCEDNGLNAFWEGNVAYYFYFLSQDGTAYLGKTDYGMWYELAVSSKITGYKVGDPVKLKVVLKGSKILCFANDQLMFGYKDNNPILGTSYGFRAGLSDVYFTDVSVSSEYIY